MHCHCRLSTGVLYAVINMYVMFDFNRKKILSCNCTTFLSTRIHLSKSNISFLKNTFYHFPVLSIWANVALTITMWPHVTYTVLYIIILSYQIISNHIIFYHLRFWKIWTLNLSIQSKLHCNYTKILWFGIKKAKR